MSVDELLTAPPQRHQEPVRSMKSLATRTRRCSSRSPDSSAARLRSDLGAKEVKLTAHCTEFREVLGGLRVGGASSAPGDHFRKVVELTEWAPKALMSESELRKYSTIDGSLQQDGEALQVFFGVFKARCRGEAAVPGEPQRWPETIESRDFCISSGEAPCKPWTKRSMRSRSPVGAYYMAIRCHTDWLKLPSKAWKRI